MRKFLALALISFPSYATIEPIKQHTPVGTLWIAHLDLPESLSQNICLLSEEIKHMWPAAQYYRETVDFGKVFHALEEGQLFERPIPPFMIEIRNQLFEIFKNKLDTNECAQNYDNCIITIYQSGDGIAPHIDRNLSWASMKEDRNYYFGESIIGLIVEPDTLQSLFFENPRIGESSRFYLEEKPGTAFIFQEALRHEWKHGVLPVERKRVSITFRKVMKREHTKQRWMGS